MKYLAVIFIAVSYFSCDVGSEPKSSNHREIPISVHKHNPDRYQVGIVIMDGVYNTELTAPYDIFQHTQFRDSIKQMDVFMIAKDLDIVTSFEGIRLIPDYAYTESYPPIDILVVPSAEHHLDTDLQDTTLIQWIRRAAHQAEYVTSHCDGAFVLAKAGLLNSVASTTFPSDIKTYKEMFPDLDVRDSVLFVHDGKYITSAGGAKSFEAALYLCEHLYGKKVTQRLAQGLVIDWKLNEVPHVTMEK